MRLPTSSKSEYTRFLFLLFFVAMAGCDDGVKVADSCGDDFLDPGEVCDGNDFGGATCADHGFYAGELGCRSDCTIDISGCELTCGDGVAQVQHEDCDRVDLQGRTCSDLGFTGGTLACTDACEYDYSACSATCGDGVVALTEGCDDGGRVAGDGCDAACQVESGWECAGSPSACDGVCGDGVLRGAEVCDDGVNDGLYGGCLPGCAAYAPRCGDGVRQTTEGELCDGADTGGVTCASSGFFGGPIACWDTCDQLDLTRCAGTFLGSWAGGGTGDEMGAALALDPAGNVFAAGIFHNGTILHDDAPLTAEQHDIFLVKYNTSGSPVWVRTFGGTGNDFVDSIATDSAGNVWMTGYFSGTVSFGGATFNAGASDIDIFLLKLDPDGQHLLSYQFDTIAEERGIALTIDASDAVWMTGIYRSTIDLGGGALMSPIGQDIFLARYDSRGVHLRSLPIRATATDEQVKAIASDQSSNVYLTGSFSGGLYVGGQQVLDADERDIFVLKFNQLGVLQWAKRFGSPTYEDEGRGIHVDATGNVWVTGVAGPGADLGGGALPGHGSGDIFLMALDTAGNPLWGQLYGSSEDDFGGTGIAPDAFGNLWLGGAFSGAADFGSGGQLVSLGIMDAFVALIAPGGDPWFALGFGGSNFDSVGDLVRSSDGRVTVTGGFTNTLLIGDDTHVAAGSTDYFIAFFE